MMKTLLLPFAAEAVLDPGPSYSRRSSVDGAAAGYVATTAILPVATWTWVRQQFCLSAAERQQPSKWRGR